MSEVLVRILRDGVVHDGIGGTFSAGAVVSASPAQAKSLAENGYAEAAPTPALQTAITTEPAEPRTPAKPRQRTRPEAR